MMDMISIVHLYCILSLYSRLIYYCNILYICNDLFCLNNVPIRMICFVHIYMTQTWNNDAHIKSFKNKLMLSKIHNLFLST